MRHLEAGNGNRMAVEFEGLEDISSSLEVVLMKIADFENIGNSLSGPNDALEKDIREFTLISFCDNLLQKLSF